ncbi:hypothetical protein AAFF_G00423640 [Aldrovandia affinis]|uniref:CUB domain-containing protein n=1 Tax=Aldrovandia affinis TaxID=143900 RepID=A0AAD7T6P7_9TELE|nr:hypothetical protein AAFF_G00423640 [Aldrovandia affinis]
MTAYLLWVTGATAQKVYFECGAVVDVVDVQGLILSPGFPYNYSSGTHCVWQFFVPVGYRIIMEMFDFDVFESHDGVGTYAAEGGAEEAVYDGASPTPRALAMDYAESPKGTAQHAPQKDEVKQVVVQEQSTKMEMAKVSNSAKWSAESFPAPASPPPLPPQPQILGGPPLSEKKNSISNQAFRGDGDPDSRAALNWPDYQAVPTPTSDPDATSAETQQPMVDACPHDVLYISDLITFSSRFCGSNRPMGRELVFGSSEEMVEVIMELITTTHWGRGFALLFHYHNRTELGDQRLHTPSATGKMDALLAAVCGAAFFAMVLTIALCAIFRPKLCPKRANACSSNNSELQEGVQNTGADVSELQLVAPDQSGLEVPVGSDADLQRPLGQPLSGSSSSTGPDISQSSELELSPNGLTELDLGTDEVFVISSGPSPGGLSFCPHTQRERFLRHSDTGPSPACDWLSPDSAGDLPAAGGRGSQGGGASSTRPRAWSVRTFQDFLPPLPQLQRKWCSWNSTSPFTKLVDSAPANSGVECHGNGPRKIFSDTHLETSNQSDSSMSNASYPLSQPAQRQRGGARRKAREFLGEGEHVSVPVFAICEEEDRQPLVMAEHLGQSPLLNGLSPEPYSRNTQAGRSPGAQSPVNGSLLPWARADWRPWGSLAPSADGGALPSDSPADAEVRELKSALVHSTANQIQPSLSRATVPCSVVGKEM